VVVARVGEPGFIVTYIVITGLFHFSAVAGIITSKPCFCNTFELQLPVGKISAGTNSYNWSNFSWHKTSIHDYRQFYILVLLDVAAVSDIISD